MAEVVPHEVTKEVYEAKEYVIEAYERRIPFFDDDISPVIGYLMLTVAVFLFAAGVFVGVSTVLGS